MSELKFIEWRQDGTVATVWLNNPSEFQTMDPANAAASLKRAREAFRRASKSVRRVCTGR